MKLAAPFLSQALRNEVRAAMTRLRPVGYGCTIMPATSSSSDFSRSILEPEKDLVARELAR